MTGCITNQDRPQIADVLGEQVAAATDDAPTFLAGWVAIGKTTPDRASDPARWEKALQAKR